MKSKFESYSRLVAWFITLLLVALAAGCGGSGGGGRDPILGTGGTVGGGGGTTPVTITPGALCTVAAGATIPTVTSSNPTSLAVNVTTSTAGVANGGKLITATFSLAMNPATINSATAPLTFTLKNNTTAGSSVAGAAVLNAAGTVATFTTVAALPVNSSFTATITQAAMSAAVTGVPLACIYAWNFTTGPVAASPAINLGLATPFALASAGGITNSGVTKINGDVVLDPNQTCNAVAVGSGNNFGACPANPPTNNAGDRVITQIFPDTTTADAVIAALNATWISIAPAALPGATVLGCGVIGNGGDAGAAIGCAGNATLPPGTYISAANSTIGVTGDLTLDAAGNPNAVWVFQAPSALNVAANSRILLTNSARASNVWWFVGSTATLVTGAAYQGNILASASIILGTGVTSCGRLLSGAAGAGSLTMLANTVSVPGHPNAPVGCL